MAYEMTWRRVPAGEAELVARASLALKAAVKARDEGTGSDEEVDAARVDLARTERSVFWVGAGFIGALRELLLVTGAAHERMGEGPTFPDLADFGLDTFPDVVEIDEQGHPVPPTEAERRYRAAYDEAHAAGIDHPGIPIHKLSSNDDWIVTPAECRSAVAAWRANRERVSDEELVEWANSGFGLGPRGRVRLAEPLAPDELVELVDEFIAWVAEAADHDGFEVR